jgi:hypothetical protein
MRRFLIALGILSGLGWGAWKQDTFIIGTIWGPKMTKNVVADSTALEKMAAAHINLWNGSGIGVCPALFCDANNPPVWNDYLLWRISNINSRHGKTVLQLNALDLENFVDVEYNSAPRWDYRSLPTHQALYGYANGSDEPAMDVPTDVSKRRRATAPWNWNGWETLSENLNHFVKPMALWDTNRFVLPVLGCIWVVPDTAFSTKWSRYQTYVDSAFASPYTKVVAYDFYVLNDLDMDGDPDYHWCGGAQPSYYKTLQLYASKSRQYNKPYWGIPHANKYSATIYDTLADTTKDVDMILHPTQTHLRFNAFSHILHGARGIMWYNYGRNPDTAACPTTTSAINAYRDASGKQKTLCERYWTSADNHSGLYSDLQAVNLEIKNMDSTLMRMRWEAVVHGASTDPASGETGLPVVQSGTPVLSSGAALDASTVVGIFSDTGDAKIKYLAVFNKDLESGHGTYLQIRGCRAIEVMNKSTGDFEPAYGFFCNNGNSSLSVSLDPGDLQLFRIRGSQNRAARVDYDGDGISDLSAVNMDGDGTWSIDVSSNGLGEVDLQVPININGFSYTIAPADYDGDGLTDLGLKMHYNGNWHIDYASDGFNGWSEGRAGWGGNNYRPVPADYDGDGKADLAVVNFDSTYGGWAFDYSANGADNSSNPESAEAWLPDVCYPTTCHAVPADYDGDGKADRGLKLDWSGGYWWFDYASDGMEVAWDGYKGGLGTTDSVPVPGYYDGDDSADVAVFSSSTGKWSIDYANNGFLGMQTHVNTSWAGFTPVPGDYDGDGRTDLAAKDDQYGEWHIDYSGNGFTGEDDVFTGWGDSDDKPLAKKGLAETRLDVRGPMITFSFALGEAGPVSIDLYSVSGAKVATLFNGQGKRGPNTFSWEKKNILPAGANTGLYFLSMKAGRQQFSKKVFLNR